MRPEPMKNNIDRVVGQLVVQVMDPDFHRHRQVQQMLGQCGLSPQGLQELESITEGPQTLSLVFAPDTRDEQLERILGICLERGHGLLLYAATVERSRIVELVARGAQGYLKWPLAHDEVVKNLEIFRKYGRHRIAFTAGQVRARAVIEKLTRRETEVLAAMIGGLRNWQIAARLGISKRTVDIHRANVHAKLETAGGSAIRIGVYAGLDQASP